MLRTAAVVSGDCPELQALLASAFFGEIDGFELAAVVVTGPDSAAAWNTRRLTVLNNRDKTLHDTEQIAYVQQSIQNISIFQNRSHISRF